MIDLKLIKILGCPACTDHPKLQYRKNIIICDRCGRRYPIECGIPIMLIKSKDKNNENTDNTRT